MQLLLIGVSHSNPIRVALTICGNMSPVLWENIMLLLLIIMTTAEKEIVYTPIHLGQVGQYLILSLQV